MSDDTVAEEILQTIPLVMRVVAAQLRQEHNWLQPAHFRMLWILSKEPHTLSALASLQSVSLPTISKSISILEERGWVQRARAPDDRRKVLIDLTPAGHDLLKQTHVHAQQRVESMVSELSAAEREQLAAGMRILRHLFTTFAEREGHPEIEPGRSVLCRHKRPSVGQQHPTTGD